MLYLLQSQPNRRSHWHTVLSFSCFNILFTPTHHLTLSYLLFSWNRVIKLIIIRIVIVVSELWICQIWLLWWIWIKKLFLQVFKCTLNLMLKFIAIGCSIIPRINLALNAKHLILRDILIIGIKIGILVLTVRQFNILHTYKITRKLIFLLTILSSFYSSITQSLHECKVFNVYFFS